MTVIGSAGTIKRRMEALPPRIDALQWEELAERAPAVSLPYRPTPGGRYLPSPRGRAGSRGGHDPAGPLRDLVAAVMTLGDAVLEIMRQWRGAAVGCESRNPLRRRRGAGRRRRGSYANTTDLTESQVDEAVRLYEQGWPPHAAGRARRGGQDDPASPRAARMWPCDPAGGSRPGRWCRIGPARPGVPVGDAATGCFRGPRHGVFWVPAVRGAAPCWRERAAPA